MKLLIQDNPEPSLSGNALEGVTTMEAISLRNLPGMVSQGIVSLRVPCYGQRYSLIQRVSVGPCQK